MNKKQTKNILKIVLLLIIACTLVFIYAQSVKPPEVSKQESDKVGEIIEEIIPPDTKPGEFIQTNLRKLAHFTEFFVLGLEIALYGVFFTRILANKCLLLPLGMILALFDETIQIFSKRGPQVKDVWIDVLGYSIALVSVYVVYYVSRVIINYVKTKRIEKTEQ